LEVKSLNRMRETAQASMAIATSKTRRIVDNVRWSRWLLFGAGSLARVLHFSIPNRAIKSDFG